MNDEEKCELPAFRTSDEEARRVLRQYRTIAVVGLSRDPHKPGHYVPA